jgi:UDP-3-O-[3-hydroxymyristoyl] N-acetylglucosamine deacetylase
MLFLTENIHRDINQIVNVAPHLPTKKCGLSPPRLTFGACHAKKYEEQTEQINITKKRVVFSFKKTTNELLDEPMLHRATIGDFPKETAGSIFILRIYTRMQNTLNNIIELSGIGLHSGRTVSMRLVPADVDHGIVFKRIDKEEGKNLIPAKHDLVTDTRLCTMITNEHGANVGTIEHLMAALRGCGVDNVLVEIDGAEVPVMDGSSIVFVQAIDATGIKEQKAARRAIKILKDITVQDGNKWVRLSPSTIPVYKGRIEFAHADIGVQEYALKLINGNFRHDVADCRTFGFLKEAEMLRAAGLGLGGSLENAIILDEYSVMNPEGLRCTDEFIRHKILDAVGDLALAGTTILGTYEGHKAGHALNNAILHALFADDSAWMPVDLHGEIDDSEIVSFTPADRAYGKTIN